MPGDGRRGRRDNGLDAASYVPLADVDPRVGEHLLDVLGSAGVPAYLEPSADVEPYTRALSLPSPPTDRLFVDRDQRGEARRIVDAETPDGAHPRPDGPRRAGTDDEPSHGLADLDEERAWREIVAGWNAPPGQARPRSPAVPADPSPAPDPADPACSQGERGRQQADEAASDPAVPTAADLDAAAEEAAVARSAIEETGAAADEEHYDPPPPPPVPRPSRHTVLAVVLIALGILLLAAPGVVALDDRTGLTFGVAAVLSGGALLVLRLRENRGDDGPDDGAIV
jgi:hypothetical protein